NLTRPQWRTPPTKMNSPKSSSMVMRTRCSVADHSRTVRSPGSGHARATRQHRGPLLEAIRRDGDPRSGQPRISLAGHPHGIKGIVRDDCMRIGPTGATVVRFELGIVGEDGCDGLTLSEQAQDELDRDAHPANDRLAPEDLRVRGDPAKDFLIGRDSSLRLH